MSTIDQAEITVQDSQTALLAIKDLDVSYGSIQALRKVSLQVMPGELVSLIGANGAGKSTLLKSIAGLLPASSGEIFFAGEQIHKKPAHTLVAKGLALVPEGRGIFGDMSVMENLLMGAYHRDDKPAIQQGIEHAFALFPRLAERQHQMAGTLSGGEQQMVAIGRALMSKPTLLLLDEPSMGLAPLLVKKIFEVIETINREGVSVLLVEQNAHVALSLASRAYVMEHGEITLHDAASALLHNPAIKAAYLGG